MSKRLAELVNLVLGNRESGLGFLRVGNCCPLIEIDSRSCPVTAHGFPNRRPIRVSAQQATPESSSAEQKADGSSSDDASEAPYVRTPKDILTAPDVVFMFSFAKSDVNDKADQRCEKASKGNAEKRAKCMTKERSKFKSDGYHFKQGDNGQWYWLTLRRKGKDLVWIHRIPIEFGESKEHEITLKITGRDRGQTPFAHPPSEVVFEVPNDYQIIQTDPDLGKLVFEAKIGILGQGTDDR